MPLVDELMLGGAEKSKIGRSYDAKKKKAATAFQLTDDCKVKRMYAMCIGNFSARSLQYIFVTNRSRADEKMESIQADIRG